MDKNIVLSKLDIKSFYETFVDSFKDYSSGQAQGICPFHNDVNPSLSMNLKNGLWNCFGNSGCNGGDVFSFYMKLKGVDFPTAIMEIAKNARDRRHNPKT